MADKQTQALKRLTKKLGALRQTLRADERSLLDRIILGDETAAEVRAHKAGGGGYGPRRAAAAKAADKAAEVRAHRLIRKADRVAKADVEAHRMQPKADSKVQPMIAFDAATGNYVVAAEGPEVEGHLLKEAVNRKVTQVTAKAAQ
jgi:hypothetical protein